MSSKCILKVIINRLKRKLQNWISPFQASFVQGHSIQDNIIIVQELIHSMKCMTGKNGIMAIKIDLEKSYNKVNWNFVKSILN